MRVHPIDALGALGVGIHTEMNLARGEITARRQVEPQVAIVSRKGAGEEGEPQDHGDQEVIQPGSVLARRRFRRSDGWRRQENAIRHSRL